MSKVKYKAVEEHILIHINTLKKWYGVISRSNYRPVHKVAFQINDRINRFKNTTYYIQDTSKVTLEQAREKFEESFGSKCYIARNPKDNINDYKDVTTNYQWGSYQQALRDHGILEEGE